MTNFDPDVIHPDVETREDERAEDVDLYVPVFPCQSFSPACLKRGFDDDEGRGNMFLAILDYTRKRKPIVFGSKKAC